MRRAFIHPPVDVVLANDHDIHNWMLGLDERCVGYARPDVGIQAERLAGRHVQA